MLCYLQVFFFSSGELGTAASCCNWVLSQVKTLSILLKRDINWKNCRLRFPSEEGKELQQLVNPAQVSLTVFVSSHSILDLPLLRASSNPQSSASLGFQ